MLSLIKLLLKTVAVVITGLATAVFSLVLLFFILVGIGVGASGVTTLPSEDLQLEYHYGDTTSTNRFLSIPITGVILGDSTTEDWSSLFAVAGVTYGYDVKEQLLQAAEDTSIAGVILEIDSPGGTIYGSKAISDGVAAYKEATGKPVIAFVSGMAASGGYWAAASADTIIADTGTGIGSIGVISGPFKYYDQVVSEDGGAFIGGVVTNGGIQTQYITAGEHKDLGNPYRPLSAEETATLQGMVNDAYSTFVEHVAINREIEPEVIRSQITALLYGDEQARQLGLIDATGSKQQAYAFLAQQAGASSYTIERSFSEPTFFDAVMGVLAPKTGAPTIQGERCPLSSHVMAYHGDLLALCR